MSEEGKKMYAPQKPRKTSDRSKEDLEFQLSLLQKRMHSPKVDLVENEEFFTVRMELPGVNVNTIKVDLKEHQVLLVSGVKQETMYEGKAKYKECKYGNFMRRVKMSSPVNYNNTFTFEDGVFTLKLTKKVSLPDVSSLTLETIPESLNWADI